MKKLLPLLLFLFLSACSAPAPAPSPVMVQAPAGLTARDLAAAAWTARPQVLRLRQTARFSFRGREVPMVGMMELDTRRNQVRLVAINQMGVKLFDLGVSEGQVSENFLLPQLARYPRFSEAVAASLRRIFLAPQPAAEVDGMLKIAGGYRLRGARNDGQVTFLFSGEPVQLVEKTALGPEEDWRVVYLDYLQTAGVSFPREIVLEDRKAGYRLDLRIDSVKQLATGIIGNEQTQK